MSYNSIPFRCRQECSGYTYFGLQWKGQCRCGNAANDWFGTRLPGYHCNTPCSYEPNVMCGGSYANSIYLVVIPAWKPNGYSGCFKDQKNPRSLEVFHGWSGYFPSKCRAACSGYKYFGLQWKGQCRCGNAEKGLGMQLDEVKCNTPCLYQTEEMCGGSWANSIYLVIPAPPRTAPVR